jgi:DNA-binding response OmpR family regulator
MKVKDRRPRAEAGLSTTESTGTEEPERQAGTAPRALVVDDSEAIRSLIVVNLELEGFEVRSARDGQEGVEAALAWHPDVVTLDVVMPRLDGFGALERLRADPATAEVPVVFVTARATAADRKRGERLGVDAYLIKPFEPAELVSVVTGLARNGRPRT